MKQIKTINFIVGSSGSGKNEVLSILSKKIDKLKFVRSFTTREPRSKEVLDQDYNFISKEKFVSLESKFMEFVEYEGVSYGHTSEDILSQIDNINHFCLIIEPNGIYQILKWFINSVEGIKLNEKYDIMFKILHIKTKKSIRVKRLLNDSIIKNDDYNTDFEKTNSVIKRIQRDDDNIDSLLEYLLENYLKVIHPSLRYIEIINNDTLLTLTTKYLYEVIEKSNDVNYYNIP